MVLVLSAQGGLNLPNGGNLYPDLWFATWSLCYNKQLDEKGPPKIKHWVLLPHQLNSCEQNMEEFECTVYTVQCTHVMCACHV